MLRNIPIPPSFSLIKKGNTFFLLNEEYKDLLLQQGIEDIDTLIARYAGAKQHSGGRSLHPSIPLRDGQRMVLRRYLHGGLLRAVTRGLYAFGSRSFQELALTEEIRSAGIPTIRPIGAVHQSSIFQFYRAYLLTLEVPGARNSIQFFQDIGSHPVGEVLALKRKLIRAAGRLVRQFHDSGFFHADLQLRNFLIADHHVLLIDFDRSLRMQNLPEKMRMKNLLRLNRSLDKWKRQGLPVTFSDRLRFFLAYAGEDPKARDVLRKALRTYSFSTLLHRWRWALEGV
jgi:tRNA A-37 threonylcarbamoyl transferase component Bud32